MRTKNKRKVSKILLFFRIISIIVIILCLIYIGHWYLENRKNAGIIKEITDSSVKDTVYVEVPNENSSLQLPVYDLDFDKLLSVNDSTVGWLRVPNTTIDYPVVKASDNAFYLNHSFDKSWNSAGWIFADYRNKFDGTDKNIIIYGHNRMDTSMFATLRNTQKDGWFNTKINNYITFTTKDGTDIYEVFSVYTIKSETYYLTTEFGSDEEYLSFLNAMKDRSIHKFDVELLSSDSIITLSTCDATGRSRVILHARKMTQAEAEDASYEEVEDAENTATTENTDL